MGSHSPFLVQHHPLPYGTGPFTTELEFLCEASPRSSKRREGINHELSRVDVAIKIHWVAGRALRPFRWLEERCASIFIYPNFFYGKHRASNSCTARFDGGPTSGFADEGGEAA